MLASKTILLGLALLITQCCTGAADKTPEEVKQVIQDLVDAKSVQLDSCTSPFNIGCCFLEVPHATNMIDLSKPDNLKPGLLSVFKPLLLDQHQKRLKKIDREKLGTHISTLYEALKRDDLSAFQRQQLCYRREQLNVLRNIVNAAQREEICSELLGSGVIEVLGSKMQDTVKEAVARMQAQGATSNTEEKADLLLEEIICVPELASNILCPEAKALLKDPKYNFNRQESVCNIGALTLNVFGNSIALSDRTNQTQAILLVLKDLLLWSYPQEIKAMDAQEMIQYIAKLNLWLSQHNNNNGSNGYWKPKIEDKKEQMLALVYIIQEAQKRKAKLCLK